MIPRYVQTRSFGGSIEFDQAPRLGALRRHQHRARALRRVALGLFTFWGGVAFAIVWFH